MSPACFSVRFLYLNVTAVRPVVSRYVMWVERDSDSGGKGGKISISLSYFVNFTRLGMKKSLTHVAPSGKIILTSASSTTEPAMGVCTGTATMYCPVAAS